jgi:hypothetical protein
MDGGVYMSRTGRAAPPIALGLFEVLVEILCFRGPDPLGEISLLTTRDLA